MSPPLRRPRFRRASQRRRHQDWRGRSWPGPSRFVRRVVPLLVFLLTLSAIGATTVSSWLFARGSEAPPGYAAALIPAAVFAMVAVTFVVTLRRVGLPFGDVVDAADRVAAGDYGVRIAERGPRFLRVVARAFNGMAGRLQQQDRQRRDLLADIAHELRTPLAVLQGRLEGVVDGVYPRTEASFAELLQETRTLSRLVEDLGTLAHAERGVLGLRKEPTDVGALLHDAVRALEPDWRARRTNVAVEVAGDLPLVDLDPIRIREVIVNLVTNAIHHSPGGGSVVVSAGVMQETLVIDVRDRGPGIPPERLAGIFDRFQKGPRSRGSGLGLTIARSLAEAHEGTLTAESGVDEGTTFTLRLPAAPVRL